MRQAGYLAEAGLFALKNNIERLAQDHHHATLIGDFLEKMDYVGHVGRRMEIFIRCDKVLAFDGYYGVSYMNICLDRFGNRFVYRGTKKWEEGKYYSVKATIKEHKEYKGEKQNVISRPTVLKTIEKEAA